jgi:phosphoribosylformylglycinamidine synthase
MAAVLGILTASLLLGGTPAGRDAINRGLRYVCRDVYMKSRTTRRRSPRSQGGVVKMPVGHRALRRLRTSDASSARARRVSLCDAEGRVTDESNPNGAARNIAGVCNREGNVVGLMPHPDRCSESLLGNDQGIKMFQSAVAALASR